MHSLHLLVCCAVLTCVALVAPATASDRLEEYLVTRRLMGEDRLREAVDRCQGLIERFPEYQPLYELLPEVANYARDLDRAQQFFLRRIEYGEELGLCYFGLGEVYYLKGESEYAYQSFRRALDLGLSQPECARKLQYSLSAWVGEQESIRYFTALCHRYPSNANNWYAAALGLFAKSQWSKARAYIEEAVRIDPFQPEYAELAMSVELKVRVSDSLLTRCGQLSNLALARGDFQSYFFLEASRVYALADVMGESFRASGIERLSSIARQYGFRKWYAWTLIKIGDHFAYQGQYDSALIRYVYAEQTASAARYDEGVGLALTAQIDVLIDRARYAPAMDASLRLLRVARDSRSVDQWISGLVKIARCLHEEGLDNLAVMFGARAIDSLELSGSETNTAIIVYDQLGQIYLGLGNQELAIRYFKKAQGAAKKFGLWVESIVIGNLAIALARTGKTGEARAAFETQRRNAIASGFPRETCYAYANLGDFYLLKSDLQRARAMYDSADAIAVRQSLWPVHLLCARGRAALGSVKGDDTEALFWAKKAFDLVDSSGNIDAACGIGVRRETGFRQDFELIVSILAKHGRVAETIVYLDRFNRHRLFTRMPERVLGSLRTLRGTGMWDIGDDLLRPGSREGARTENGHELPSSFAEMPERPVKPEPEFFGEDSRKIAALLPGEAAVSYVVGREKSYALLMRPDTLACRILPVGKSELLELLHQLSPAASGADQPVPSVSAELANFSSAASRALYNLLVRPFENLLLGVSSLIVVPDDILRSVPFEVLEDSLRRPLIVRFPVSYALSPSLIRRVGGEVPAKENLLALGVQWGRSYASSREFSPGDVDPIHLGISSGVDIPGAVDEVKRVAGIIGSRTVVLTGPEATRTALLDRAREFRILHIAAHATFDRQVPWLSAIHCEKGESGGSELSVTDVLGLQLKSDLVVLSGCNTAWIFGGKDLIGLSGAFSSAGARRVIASLWYVDDFTTAGFMENYYRGMVEGASAAEALRQAKLAMIRGGKSDPFYWAPFILLGDPGPVNLDRTTGIVRAIPYVVALICLIVLGGGAARLRTRHRADGGQGR